MKKLILLSLLVSTTLTHAQVGIGTTSSTDNSAVLEIKSTTKGLLPPRMTTSQILAIPSPAEGLVVFCTDCTKKNLYVYDGLFFNDLSGTASLGVQTVDGVGGATWMDRNLGATQVAASSTDSNAYGYLYQWGRTTDGHQSRSSMSSADPVVSGSEGANFITVTNSPYDWLSIPDNSRWNGSTKGAYDPCPAGYRVPTKVELETERLAWSANNSNGAYASLKLTLAGSRDHASGDVTQAGTSGFYWASTTTGDFAEVLQITSSSATTSSVNRRAYGNSIRCIKE